MKRPAFVGAFDIPKVIQLPGCRVRVRVVPPEEAGILHECDGAAIYSYEKQTAVILIDSRLPIEMQRYTLLHELLHVVHEAIDIMLEYESAHVATKSMLAMRGQTKAPAEGAGDLGR